MAVDNSRRRINRLAKKARALDNMIVKAAKMQKELVEEIRKIGTNDKLAPRQRMTKARKLPRFAK
jgi:hypothetical protein